MITNDILTALMFSCGDDCLNGAQITTHLRKAVTAILPLATFWKSHFFVSINTTKSDHDPFIITSHGHIIF